MVLLTAALFGRDWQPALYVPLKLVQAAAVCYLVWRWRKLVPEINWKFHWLVIPVSLALTAAWIYLNELMHYLSPVDPVDQEPNFFATLYAENQTLFWFAAAAHLIAMCTAVPMVEETFNRSLLLRSFSSAKRTGVGFMQFLCDMPVIGDWLIHTKAGTRATQQPPVFGPQFEATPLGHLTFFGVIASSLVFALVHGRHDWPGAIVCGVVWCLLLAKTRHLGLGPVIWSHALVNLLLWAHVVWHHEWRFM